MSSTIPARIIAKVTRDFTDTTGYPYYYTVDAFVPGEAEPAVIDYGSHPTRELACASIEYVLAHRDRCDNPEYVHTPGLVAGPVAHEFQAARFTGTVTCARCGLLPLDADDIDSWCAGSTPTA